MNGVPQHAIPRFWVIGLLASSCCGCAANPLRFDGSPGQHRNFYDLYDNSRDWGPSYLVEPPNHYLGDQARIDDSRTAPLHQSEPQAAPAPSTSMRPLPLLP